jgi:hypothetical protein
MSGQFRRIRFALHLALALLAADGAVPWDVTAQSSSRDRQDLRRDVPSRIERPQEKRPERRDPVPREIPRTQPPIQTQPLPRPRVETPPAPRIETPPAVEKPRQTTTRPDRKRAEESVEITDTLLARYGRNVPSRGNASRQAVLDEVYAGALRQHLPGGADVVAGPRLPELHKAIPPEKLIPVLERIPEEDVKGGRQEIRIPGTPNDKPDPPTRGMVPSSQSLDLWKPATIRQSLATSGRLPAPFFVYGFKDVVLLAHPDGRPCTATHIDDAWLVTAAHCVARWSSGRSELVPHWRELRAYRVLDGADERWWDARGYVRGAALGSTPALTVDTIVIHEKWERRSAYDIAVINVRADGPAAPRRLASLSKAEVGRTPYTIVGFGGTNVDRHRKGLEVGWQEGKPADGLTFVTAGGPSANCVGDSGGPVFGGQQFGFADEPHVLIGVISAREVVPGKDSDACAGTLGYMARLDTAELKTWLCEKTGHAADGCR